MKTLLIKANRCLPRVQVCSEGFLSLVLPSACSCRNVCSCQIKSKACENKDWPDLTWFLSMCLSIRQPVNPRTRQQPQPETSPQEPEEPEEILGSDDEEQEDPHDYCKGDRTPFFSPCSNN